MGEPGAIVTNAAIVAKFAVSMPELMRCLPGSIRGFEDILPASFMNATIEPVNVIPPNIISVESHLSRFRHTNKDTEVGGDEMQGRDMRKICHNATNACQDSSETDNRMEGGDGLGKIGGRDPLANEEA